MGYKIEDIFKDVKGFQDTCNTLLTLADNEEIKEKLMEILYSGSYKGFYFCSNICTHNSPYNDARRRLSMACIFLHNPDTFEFLVNNKINIFHGVNANALPSILEEGLKSYDNLIKNGINVSTGESWSRMGNGRNFISFTDVFDVASDYSSFSSTEKNILSFGAVIGTTVQDINNSKRQFVGSDLPEVGIRDEMPLLNIKVIGVPSEKLAFVKKLAGNSNVTILPMDNINNKLFYADEDWHSIIINEEVLNKLKLRQESKPKEFSINEMYYLAVTRKLSKMKKTISKFKNSFRYKKNKKVVEEEIEDGRKIK